MTNAEVTVQFAGDAPGVPDATAVRDWVVRTLAASAGDGPCGRAVAVRVVDEAEGRTLNRRYRGHDRPTNVLSFPAAPAEAFAAIGDSETLPLGDLVLCAPLVAREAAEQGKPAAHHWAHLLVHGTLHLLGFDHQDERGARAMEALEIRILAAGGIDDPYRERYSR